MMEETTPLRDHRIIYKDQLPSITDIRPSSVGFKKGESIIVVEEPGMQSEAQDFDDESVVNDKQSVHYQKDFDRSSEDLTIGAVLVDRLHETELKENKWTNSGVERYNQEAPFRFAESVTSNLGEVVQPEDEESLFPQTSSFTCDVARRTNLIQSPCPGQRPPSAAEEAGKQTPFAKKKILESEGQDKKKEAEDPFNTIVIQKIGHVQYIKFLSQKIRAQQQRIRELEILLIQKTQISDKKNQQSLKQFTEIGIGTAKQIQKSFKSPSCRPSLNSQVINLWINSAALNPSSLQLFIEQKFQKIEAYMDPQRLAQSIRAYYAEHNVVSELEKTKDTQGKSGHRTTRNNFINQLSMAGSLKYQAESEGQNSSPECMDMSGRKKSSAIQRSRRHSCLVKQKLKGPSINLFHVTESKNYEESAFDLKQSKCSDTMNLDNSWQNITAEDLKPFPTAYCTMQELENIGESIFLKMGVRVSPGKYLQIKKFEKAVRFSVGGPKDIIWEYNTRFYYGETRIEDSQLYKHGQGLEIYDGRYRYKGGFIKGKRHGHGQMLKQNGSEYKGQWQNGYKSGRGFYKDQNGVVYDGEFMENQKHGFGVQETPEYKYEGQFTNSCKNGEGIITYKSGKVFHVLFNNDKIEKKVEHKSQIFIKNPEARNSSVQGKTANQKKSTGHLHSNFIRCKKIYSSSSNHRDAGSTKKHLRRDSPRLRQGTATPHTVQGRLVSGFQIDQGDNPTARGQK